METAWARYSLFDGWMTVVLEIFCIFFVSLYVVSAQVLFLQTIKVNDCCNGGLCVLY